MFAFDFDGLKGDEGKTAVKEQPRPKTSAKAKVKAKAKIRSRGAEPDYLMQLQIEEKERAAAALAMMKAQMAAAAAPPPSMTRPAPSPMAMHQQQAPTPVVVQRQAPRIREVRHSSSAADRDSSPEVLPVSMQDTRALGGGVVAQPTEKEEPVEMRQAREEETARRAEAEAAVQRSIEHDRRSGWWRRLEEPARPAVIERCGALPLHVWAGRASSSSSVQRLRLHNPLGLPVQDFSVECAVATIRAEPSMMAAVCGAKRIGDRVKLVEESFDGWAKLAEEPGWIQRVTAAAAPASSSPEGQPVHLSARGGPSSMLLASSRPSRSHGRQMFEVLCEAGVDIFREPSRGALRLGTRSCGEFLLADSQSYHGWIRLSNGEGWAQAVTEGGKRFLQPIRPDELQLAMADEDPHAPLSVHRSTSGEVSDRTDRDAIERAQAEADAREREEAARQEALRALENAARTGVSSAMFCAAVEVARGSGVAKRDIARCNALRNCG